MSNYIMKHAAKRFMKDGQNKKEQKYGAGFPYYEYVPKLDGHGRPILQRDGQPKLKKQDRNPPPYLSKQDTKACIKARRWARRLDENISLCCGASIGWSVIFGLVPVIGDFLDSILAVLGVYRHAMNAKVGPVVGSQMTANIVIDALIGLVPVLGDIADGFYKSNTKNYALLLEVLIERSAENEKADLRNRQLPSSANHPERLLQKDAEKQALGNESGRSRPNDKRLAANKMGTQTRPEAPKPAMVAAEKSSGKGWFNKFTSTQNNERDLEMADVHHPQPLRTQMS